MTHKITLIPGDGIGTEVTQAVVRILEATGLKFEWETVLVEQPSVTRVLLLGALLVALIVARPQGLLGSPRVDTA